MATYLPGVTDFIPDIQPFQPDWSTVDRTMRLKQGTYDSNYASLQGTYSGLLNMPQLKQDQIVKRDKFLQQAFKNLGDLSSVDLSLPENVASANNVFAPLYNDQDFLGNSAISKHYQQQEQVADSFRLKDNGANYSQDNLNYVRMQKADYINDQSPESWRKYYANKRSYEPYYDYAKELGDLNKNFKPSNIDVEYVDGAYIRRKKDSSVTANEYSAYLQANLSDKARRQLQIEGTVRLGSNVPALTERFLSSAAEGINEINKNIKLNEEHLKLAHTEDEKRAINSNITDLENNRNKLSENIAKIQSGDNSYIQNNKEGLANKFYYSDFLSKTLKGAVRKDITEEVKPNSVWTTIYTQNQENGRQQRSFENARQMKELDFQYDIKKMQLKGELAGATKTGDPTFTGNALTLNTTEVKDFSEKDILEKIQENNQGIQNAGQVIKGHLLSTIGAAGINEKTIKEFIAKNTNLQSNTAPVFNGKSIVGYQNKATGKMLSANEMADLQVLQKYQGAVFPLETYNQNLKYNKSILDSEAKKTTDYKTIDAQLSKLFNGKKITVGAPGNKVSLSAREFYDGVADGSIKVDKFAKDTRVEDTRWTDVFSIATNKKGLLTLPWNEQSRPGNVFTVKGVQVPITEDTRVLQSLYTKVKDLQRGFGNKTAKQSQSKLDKDIYGAAMSSNDRMSILDPQGNFSKTTIANIEALTGIDKNSITLRGLVNTSGEVGFSLSDDKKTQALINQLGTIGNGVTYDAVNQMFKVSDLKNTKFLEKLSPSERSMYDFLENGLMGKNMGDGIRLKETLPFSVDPALPYNFIIKKFTKTNVNKTGNPIFDYEYHIYEANNPNKSLFPGNPNASAIEALNRLRTLGEDPQRLTQYIESLK